MPVGNIAIRENSSSNSLAGVGHFGHGARIGDSEQFDFIEPVVGPDRDSHGQRCCQRHKKLQLPSDAKAQEAR
jgi:hypothetical protein